MAAGAPPTVRWVTVGVVVAGAVAVLGIVALWPRGEAPDLGIQPNRFVDATVTSIETGQCQEVEVDTLGDCELVGARLTSGPDRGGNITFQVRATQFEVPPLETGDKVVLLDVESSPTEFRYSFADFQRSTPMLWLVGAFGVAVVAFGRWLGVRALVGLAVSGLVLVAFVVPALLRDEPAVPVALAGGVMIAFVSLYLAHGVRRSTTVALAGTLASLAVTTGLAALAVAATQLTGLADDEAQVLRVTADALDLRGLLIAGIVVGALGVLDDVTVSQVSTVAALRRANPSLGAVRLYREAIRVGRDHVASVVNTLILAYAGASLPLLLFFAQGSQPIGRLVTSEIIAVEVVRMLVGSIGLILAVPITTALAAAVLAPDDDLDGFGHDHGHGHDLDRRPFADDPFAARSTPAPPVAATGGPVPWPPPSRAPAQPPPAPWPPPGPAPGPGPQPGGRQPPGRSPTAPHPPTRQPPAEPTSPEGPPGYDGRGDERPDRDPWDDFAPDDDWRW